MKPKIILLDPEAAKQVNRLACFSARLTQRTIGPMDSEAVVKLYYKPISEELVHNLIISNHNQCFRMNMVPVVVIGASRRFIAQITRHQVGISFMATSLQYCAWADPNFYGDEIDEVYNTYQKQLAIYREMLQYGSDKAGYFIPEGVQGSIIISATPWEWRHIIETRTCNRNTPETIEIVEEIKRILEPFSEVFRTGPPCTKNGCKEAHPCQEGKK